MRNCEKQTIIHIDEHSAKFNIIVIKNELTPALFLDFSINFARTAW